MRLLQPPDKDCVCGPGAVKHYLNKISGPLLDRIDLHIEVTPVSFDKLAEARAAGGNFTGEESSQDIRTRVEYARKMQSHRFSKFNNIYCNSQMPSRMVREVCILNKASQLLLKTAMTRLQLSARAYDRILKVARTAADLAGSPQIETEHVAEAIQLRSLDRELWSG